MERPEINFLYLNEKDMIKAGVKDLEKCVETTEEMFRLLGEGDYIMGGANRNSHGIKIFFPEESPFPNMPVAGPDRRFMALAGYLGGKYNVCGMKWYGSNIGNKEKGLPRSILTAMLNDPVTGAPLVFMSANILSSVRTGALPGVAAKYLARKDSKILGIVGAGVIGRSCMEAILHTCKGLEEVRIYDVYEDLAREVAKEIEEEFKIKATSVTSLKEAMVDSDIINFATAGDTSPKPDEAWFKKGVLVTLPGSVDVSKEFFCSQKIVVDNWKMYEAYRDELRGLPGTFADNNSGICGSLMDYVFDGDLPLERVISLGDIVAGKEKARENDDEIIISIADGMPVQDLAWGWEVYQNALENGIGQTLNLF